MRKTITQITKEEKEKALATARARTVPKNWAKEVLKKEWIKHGSSLCEIKTFAKIFEMTPFEAGLILEDFFLEDAIEEFAI